MSTLSDQIFLVGTHTHWWQHVKLLAILLALEVIVCHQVPRRSRISRLAATFLSLVLLFPTGASCRRPATLCSNAVTAGTSSVFDLQAVTPATTGLAGTSWNTDICTWLMSSDLCLTAMNGSFRLEPMSIVGMIWLQTHFETDTWDLICSGTVRISAESSRNLQRDAMAAGLIVQRIQVQAPA